LTGRDGYAVGTDHGLSDDVLQDQILEDEACGSTLCGSARWWLVACSRLADI